MSTIDVYSEVGKVKKILVSRPELYLTRFVPTRGSFSW